MGKEICKKIAIEDKVVLCPYPGKRDDDDCGGAVTGNVCIKLREFPPVYTKGESAALNILQNIAEYKRGVTRESGRRQGQG